MGETQGTILETFHVAIREGGMEEKGDEALKATIGIPLLSAFKALYPRIDEAKAKELVALYRKNYLEKCFLTLKPMSGLTDTLSALEERGVRLAVVSSRRTDIIVKLCEALKIRPFFCAFVGEELVKNPKPAPDMALLAMTVLGAEKKESLMVGDTHFDMAMGRVAGIDTCFASYGYGKPETVVEDHPTYQIASLPGLLKVVEGRG